MPAEKKNKGGRPSKFETINQDQLKKLAQKGWTDAEMADFFGVTEQSFNNYKKAHPEFFESLKDWKAEADQKVEKSLFERATGYQHPDTKFFMYEGAVISEETIKHYPPDTTAAIFWLKNRKPEQWREKQPDETDAITKIEIVRRRIPTNDGNDSD